MQVTINKVNLCCPDNYRDCFSIETEFILTLATNINSEPINIEWQ